MKARHFLVLGFVGLWGLLPGVWHTVSDAQEGELTAHPEHHAVMEENEVVVDPHRQPDPNYQRPAILPPEEDKAYSEFNHRIAGVFVLLAGGLALLATVGGPRYAWARHGWPGLFVLLGIFLFVRHDPESWPWGPFTFWESVTDAQVLQHILFTLIVFAIGIIEWLRYRRVLTHAAWGWLFPSLAVSAALMLFMHKHGEGPVADKIYRYHAIMAVSGILAMIAKVFDDSRLFDSRISAYIWTTLIMFVGLLLLIYTE
jgi:copper resistance protein D